MHFRLATATLLACLTLAGAGYAEDCPGHPDALGTSRVIAIDPAEHKKLGTLQYIETLPLRDHEVVLTFDDGPLPPYTSQVLDALQAECVKATFFAVGQMARANPALVQREYREGHTIGTHTEHHAHLDKISTEAARKEISDGIASLRKAAGEPSAVAPFFRFPYLDQTSAVEEYALQNGLMVWSVDFFVSDWNRITPEQVVNLALERVERRQKGMLLLHDIQSRTAAALPTLLRELKKRGYHIVHIVPADGAHPKTDTKSDKWAAN